MTVTQNQLAQLIGAGFTALQVATLAQIFGAGGGGTPGGADGEFQFNDAGSFGGITGSFYNSGTGGLGADATGSLVWQSTPDGGVATYGYLDLEPNGSYQLKSKDPSAVETTITGSGGALTITALDPVSGLIDIQAGTDIALTATVNAEMNADSGGADFAGVLCDGANSIVQITGLLVLATAVDAFSDKVGTLTNAPTVGNPAIWVTFKIGGNTYAFPAWTTV